MLCNISPRINLYNISKIGTYNQRSVSTLAVETFLGDLNAMEFSGLSCPKSTDTHRLMSHVIQITQHILDPQRDKN